MGGVALDAADDLLQLVSVGRDQPVAEGAAEGVLVVGVLVGAPAVVRGGLHVVAPVERPGEEPEAVREVHRQVRGDREAGSGVLDRAAVGDELAVGAVVAAEVGCLRERVADGGDVAPLIEDRLET